ncbi:Glucokinase [Podosphaera aphanis]|nr:Glucokinase [Podosphaera aphanis]
MLCSPKLPADPVTSGTQKMVLEEAARRVAAEFEVPDEKIRKIVDEFIFELRQGLEENDTMISQIPSYVTVIPNGTEKGLYLAVDLGGTNFRVCSIQLNGDTTFDIIQSKGKIPAELKVAKTAKDLFSFLAKQIENFLKEHHEERYATNIRRRQTLSTFEGYKDEHIFRLGFTFSFPVYQSGINKGKLMRWTKGFDIPGAVNQDVCALLQQEIDSLKMPIIVAALVNDTVGTLMARSYTTPGKSGCVIGAIFGTGTNGAYIEKLSALKKPVEGEFDKSSGIMVINSEWGSFDNDLKVLPTTSYDDVLDNNSSNPGIQMFEKRISGMFIGEIMRISLVSLTEDPSISMFKETHNISSEVPLFQPWSAGSSILSIAEGDNSVDLCEIRQEIRNSLGVPAVSFEHARAIKIIANAIGKRAARLAGAAIAAMVVHTGRLSQPCSSASSIPSTDGVSSDTMNVSTGANSKVINNSEFIINEENIIDIGVDGSLIEFYPNFEEYMREAFRAVDKVGLIGDKKIRIGIAKDGSGVGAALIALLAADENQRNSMDGQQSWNKSDWSEIKCTLSSSDDEYTLGPQE